ncbi:BnaCnng08470D [Brassica napus]|uniref:BnaCnng08470D protein n=1 Tax=Brassica napus TaxID=3708 RepID=A0A078HIH0_BRANA|nr:BnaCnng08470D [Brassica napus]
MLLGLLTGLLTCDLRRLQSSLPYNQNADLLTVSSIRGWIDDVSGAILLGEHSAKRKQEGHVGKLGTLLTTIKVLNMIKLHGKPICVNKASQDKKIIDVGANLWKQLKRWFIFTLLQKDAH